MELKAVFVLFLLYKLAVSEQAQDAQKDIIYKFISVDYDWQNATVRKVAINNGDYVVGNNIITGIKVYKNDVYVTVPRWRRGVPSTLNKIITSATGTPILRSFPSWDMNKVGDCEALQYVQSMEIDPNTGLMWIIDTGRLYRNEPPSIQKNACPSKLVILDINTMNVIRKFEFPADVVYPTSNFLNDIVLDYVNGNAQFAYISDTNDAKIVVYDFELNISYFFHDKSMEPVPLIPGLQDGMPSVAIDGIAMSPDFRFVYYCALPALNVYAISTDVLRHYRINSSFSDNVKLVGLKRGGSDGLIFGQNNFYYAVLETDAVYSTSVTTTGLLSFANETELVTNKPTVSWVDTFAFNGTDLWFVANRLSLFFSYHMNFHGSIPNVYIWKVNVEEEGYLADAIRRTGHSNVAGILG